MKNRNLWRVLMVLLLALPMMTVSAQTFNEDVTNPSATKIKTWSTALEALFADRACSQLNETYAAYTSAQMQADANWQALPGTLQKMVLKMVAGGTWSEDNVDSTKPAWDAEYAKRLRVQLIEPYNDPGNAAAALTMNAHTNLNNPLGIYGNNKQVLYIMVEGEVKTGSTLYLATWTGHGKPGNGVSEGTQLKPGLNVVTLTADGTTGCINYVVQTLDNSKGNGNKARVRKLSDYADLKVHVEGGILNGFYNAVGDELWGEGDNNADWDYYAARATHADLTVLGKYMTLQFPLHDELTEGNKGLGYYFTGKNTAEAIVEVWDNVMLWERLLMGLASKQQYSDANAKWKSPYSDKSEVFAYTGDNEDPFFCDYEDYYNVHGLAFGVGGTSYMYGSWDHSGYHYNTMGSIMGDIINSSGSYWGPGHEIGHQHQQPFTLNGLTEVTNNLFSNVVLWYVGKSTSRVNGDQGALFQVYDAFCTKGGDFYTNNIWALTHMYYRLFLYYHVLGHNTDFYPRLYEMLRQDPMKKSYNQDGAVGLLHFYKKACMAAGEDLTEFFRAHGMLEVMESRFVGDYANSIYNTTQQQVDAAIAEVKALGYKENLSVLFINDGTGEKITGCTGQELSLFDGATTANVGSYAYFYTPAADYTYTISNGKITMKGTGGVGYLVLNEAGEIVAFSNKKTFTITDDVAYLLMTGKAAVQAINGDNTTVPATTDMTTLQRNLLNTLLTKAKAMAKLSDDTGMKVGYYKSNTLAPINEAVTVAQQVYNNKTVEQYVAAYEDLYKAVKTVENNPDAMNVIIPGSTYVLKNGKTTSSSMSINRTSKAVSCSSTNTNSQLQRWVFERAGAEDTYYIKSVATGTYLAALANGKQVKADDETPTVAYKVISMGDGMMAVQCQDDNSQSLNYNSGIGVLGWTHEGDKGSWWYITAVELNQAELNRTALKQLIDQTNALLNEMGEDVMLPGALPLQVEADSNPFYLFSNADQNVVGTSADGNGVAGLIDGNTNTYLHTQWSGTPVSSDHYLQVNLGGERALTDFAFRYATRNASDAGSTSPAPTTIKVYGSTNGTTFSKLLGTFTKAAKTNPLPAYTELGAYWTSADIVSTTPYKSIRFIVSASAGPGSNKYGNHAFFAMSEFSLINHTTVVNSLKTDYVGGETVYTEAADQMYQSMLVRDNAEATPEEVAASLAELQAKYDALNRLFTDGPTGISSVLGDADKRIGIYDLSGRRLNEIKTPGIYIINGQKKIVK